MSSVKITIKDEVNCKIEGLEVGDRRALMKMFEFEKPGARYLPAVRLGRWNGKISYFSLSGRFLNIFTATGNLAKSTLLCVICLKRFLQDSLC